MPIYFLRAYYQLAFLGGLLCKCCETRNTRPKESRRQPPTQLVIDRALKQYQIDFRFEISDLKKPKVLCSGCRTRLAYIETEQ